MGRQREVAGRVPAHERRRDLSGCPDELVEFRARDAVRFYGRSRKIVILCP